MGIVQVILITGLESSDEVRPFGLDLCSGFRIDGAVDPSRLETLIRMVGY
ncbi:MAG: hypothetical protein R3211_03775 [Balneolaceae bacterium]|nr:hypothetical protein [Balneolaceae bacterium]